MRCTTCHKVYAPFTVEDMKNPRDKNAWLSKQDFCFFEGKH